MNVIQLYSGISYQTAKLQQPCLTSLPPLLRPLLLFILLLLLLHLMIVAIIIVVLKVILVLIVLYCATGLTIQLRPAAARSGRGEMIFSVASAGLLSPSDVVMNEYGRLWRLYRGGIGFL